MQEKRRGLVVRLVLALWSVVDWTRRIVVNALVFALVVLLLGLFFSGGAPKIPAGAALVVAPVGTLVEQFSGTAGERALRGWRDSGAREVLIQDQVRAIREAADDKRIGALVLRLDGLVGGGLTKLQQLRAALVEFKQSGKPVIAAGDFYSQNQYYLAAVADEIWLHPMGDVFLEGYAGYNTYYREAIDLLELDWHVFRVGEYKTAVEPFLRSDMSDEAREAQLSWMTVLWDAYQADVAAARGQSVAEIEAYIDGYTARLEAYEGDAARIALDAKLVDHVASRDGARDRLVELVGEDEKGDSFKQVTLEAYLEALGPDEPGKGDAVGVVIAAGVIEDGSRSPGSIGGDSTARQIRDLRLDEGIKAIVLRVDSGGGSTFASEVIRREVELARQAGKPVVASMGSVAASGGYWILMSADEIWAQETTITGSIGIFGMFPTYQRTLAKIGLRTDGVGTTPLAGALRADRAMSPEVAGAIQSMVNRGYREFITRVAEEREMTVEQVDQIARGRVWSGADAHRLGLLDELGGLEEAIASAAGLAGLGDDYAVRYPPEAAGFGDLLLAGLLTRVRAWGGEAADETFSRSLGHPVLASILEQVRLLERFNDPNGLYAYCDCAME